MSEADDNKRMADMVREHGQAVEKAAELEKSINALAERLSVIGSCMRIDKGSQQPVNAVRVASFLAQLPEAGISPDQIRQLLADHAEVTGRLVSIRSQLTPFGFKF